MQFVPKTGTRCSNWNIALTECSRSIIQKLPIRTLYYDRALNRNNFFFPVALQPKAGHGLLIDDVSRSHTTTVGLLWASDQGVAETSTWQHTALTIDKHPCRDLYLTTHSTHNRQTSMPPVGFEPTISAVERPQTYALDRAAIGTGTSTC